MILTTSSDQPATKRIKTGRPMALTVPTFWPLILILAMQSFVAIATLHNSAFQDEGLYLYAGRQILRSWLGGPAPLEHYAFYFSGYPDFYPVLGGLLNTIGGLQLARGFSLACMLGVNIIIYTNTRKFFTPMAAIFASALYASLGTVLFVSRLATFDALCLFLIALAASTAYRASSNRGPWLALLLGPLIVLAILAKYAAMLFSPPVLGILLFCTLYFRGLRGTLLRFTLAIASLAVSLLVAYYFMDKLAFHAIAGSTTNRVAEIQQARLAMFLHVLQMGGVVYAAELLGLVVIFFRHRRLILIALVLVGASGLVPAYHIYEQEAVSLDKHMAFSLFFAMPLAGFALAWLAGSTQQVRSSSAAQRVSSSTPRVMPGGSALGGSAHGAFADLNGRYWLAGVAVVAIVFTLGLQQSQWIYSSWANTSQLSYMLHTQMRDGSGRFLIEDIEVCRYDAQDVTEPWQWNGVNYFYYVTSDGQQLLGDPALAQAIKDRYFALVELSFNYQPAEARFVAQQMAATANYDLIATVLLQNSYGIGHFYLWRGAATPGQGNFTNIAQVGLTS